MSWIYYNQHLRDDTRFGDQPGERSSVITQSWLCCRCQVEQSFPGEGRCSSFDLFRSWECFFFLLSTFCWLTFLNITSLYCYFSADFDNLVYATLFRVSSWLLLGWKVHVWRWTDESRTPHLHPNPSSESSVPSLPLSLSLWKADSSITNRCDWISHLSLMSPWSQQDTVCIPIRRYLGFCPPCWQKPIFSFYDSNLQREGLHYVLLDEGVII